ncbi:BAR-domain-containing protein [Hesseltinella vesiculosa]|uniref:BAR-domain-containing protein n=1 Tax=Hesseltinella vesiculosa TaxID=101127 RepID=A0A1X2GDQ8_9FUNG|nr:BAR-domain-containing protein [Hesseltinella vesiculosa]
MIKRFGKLRQWVGENIGSSHSTLPSEEFQELQTETKTRHHDYDRLVHSLDSWTQTHQKSRLATEKHQKRTPGGVFGEALVTHADMFPRDSPQWEILTTLGLAECHIDEQTNIFMDHAQENYVRFLQYSAAQYKEYQALCRKLESRRLDYDAKQNRLQRVTKEMPELELEVQAAKTKYEESEYSVVQMMMRLQDEEDLQFDALRSFLVSQIGFHRTALQALENIQKKWDEPVQVAAKDSDGKSRNKSLQLPEPVSDGDNIDLDTLEQRRALYSHEREHDDELSIQVGDIIYVLDHVDDGWWVGLIPRGENRFDQGIFPVNFTETYPPTNAHLPNPSTPDSRSSSLDQPSPPVPSPAQQQQQDK